MGFRRALSRHRRPWRGVCFWSVGGDHRVGEAGGFGGAPAFLVRRFWLDAAGQKLAPHFEGLGIWGGLRREPAGNLGLGATGWGHAGVGMEERSRGRAGWRTQPLREPECQRGEFRRSLARLTGTV